MRKFTIKGTLCVMFGLLAVGQAFAANCAANYVPPENPVWDGSTQTEPCTKDGFYIIDNAAKLAWYAKNYDKGNAKLTADIDLGSKLWIPIAAGKGDKLYGKTFNGQNHIIKNLYINGNDLSPINATYPQNLGFVAALGGGKVLNLVLENVDIQASTNAGTIISSQDNQISVGAVVGWMSDKNGNVVDNCIVTGTIKTTGNSQGVGGIVGNAKKGTISNCMSLVEIYTSGSKAYIGGIIGITKTDVTVSSCVYAGPGLINTGSDGAVGGITGNVFSGTMTAEDSYYEGEGITYNGQAVSGVGGSCLGNIDNKTGLCKDNKLAVNDSTINTSEINADSIACALNGIDTTTGACKTEPWSVGETSLSLNGYGADGYKIVFDANGGAFANGKANKNKFLDGGMAITADEVENPSRDNYSFAGWAKTRDAVTPATDLGSVSKSDSVFAVWKPVYTVTFDVNPGVFPDADVSVMTKRITSGDVVTVEGLGSLPTSYCSQFDAQNQCETYMYFSGWALSAGASLGDTVELGRTGATEGLKLYAVWDPFVTYTVTYNANNHGTTVVDYVRVGRGESVDPPTNPIADDGYEFGGWFTDENGENPYTFKSEIHESIILYAKWTPIPYSISYVMNEGSGNGNNPISYTVDTEITLSAPADVEGYVFEGWFYDAQFTSPATQIIKGTTGTKTFYAKFSAQTYKITYLPGNAPYGAASDQVKTHGTPIELRSSGYFTFPGFDQAGWSTAPNGETEYELGATYSIDAPLTLYPTKGGKATYTITYECEGCNLDNTTYTSDDQFDLISDPIPHEGFRFAWYIDQAYTTTISQIKKGSYGNLNLHGRWNKLYTITYQCEGCDVSDDEAYPKVFDIESQFSIAFPTTIPEGYRFGGWYKKSSFAGNPDPNLAKGTKGDFTFYGKLNKIYNIEYVLNGSTESRNKDNYTVDDKTFTLNAPAPVDGFTFGGWYTNAEFEGDAVTQVPQGSTGDKIFYAKWNKVYPFVTQSGAVTITEYANGTAEAVIDGDYEGTDAVTLEEDIEVTSVVWNRDFGGVPATITLPFEIDVANVEGAKFYNFGGMATKADGKKAVQMNRVKEGKLAANTPYGVRPTGSTITFNGPVTFKKTEEASVTVGEWKFVGLFAKYVVTESDEGRLYGFAGESKDGISQGKFVRFYRESPFKALRAYMLNIDEAPPTSLAPGLFKSAPINRNIVSPLEMEVEWIDDEEGTMNLRKSLNAPMIFKSNKKFDLKGRSVGEKSKVKGVYYDKGGRK